MPKGRRTRVWNALAVVTVLGAVASLADRASFGGLIIIGPSQCVTNADCSCTQQDCSAPGQGGFCVPINATLGVCQCNPGFGGANCSLTIGACCGASPPILNMTNPFPANGGVACRDLTELQCSFANGTSVTFAGNGTSCGSGICDPTHTPRPTERRRRRQPRPPRRQRPRPTRRRRPRRRPRCRRAAPARKPRSAIPASSAAARCAATRSAISPARAAPSRVRSAPAGRFRPRRHRPHRRADCW